MRSPAKDRERRSLRAGLALVVGGGLLLSGIGSSAALAAPTAAAPGVERAASAVEVGALRTDGAQSPLSLDSVKPRLTWQLASEARGVVQRAYEVRVATSAAGLEDDDPLWTTGRVDSDEQAVVYGGPRLRPRSAYAWSVRVWTDAGATAWAPAATFETGLLAEKDWNAQWIAAPAFTPTGNCSPMGNARVRTAACTPPSPRFRKDFEVSKPVARARLYASGLGYGVYSLNGSRSSDAVLDPGFTDYDDHFFYVAHDVTDLIEQGGNAIGAELGRGYFGMQGYTFAGYASAPWKSDPVLRLELDLTYEDGTREVVRTGTDWRTTDGPSRFADVMLGETYDARRDQALDGWDRSAYDAAAWTPARTVRGPRGQVAAQVAEPITPQGRIAFESVKETAPGRYLFDLGTNVAGSVILDGDIPTGTQIELRYGEKLRANGRIDNDMIAGYGSYFGDLQVDQYIGGEGPDRWRPEFSYKGFQYVEVSGLTEAPTTDLLTAEVWHNDVAEIGEWTSSSPLADAIVANTKRAVESNLFWQPTDTPIYEKSGYTGDGQLMLSANSYLYDMQRFYTKWSRDIAGAQKPGRGDMLGIVAPSALPDSTTDDGWPGATPGWDVALFNVPEAVHLFSGDDRALRQQLPSLRRYKQFIDTQLGEDGVLRGACQTLSGPNPCTNGAGDWTAPDGMPYGVSVDSTAWYHEMLRIYADAAEIDGDAAAARQARAQMERVAADFDAAFWDDELGAYRNDARETVLSQHQQAIALGLGLVPEAKREQVADALAENVRERGHHNYTGIMGTRFIWEALSRNGHADDAVSTLLQKSYPSYGYWIDELGWDSLGEYWEASSRSQNHMMYGSVVGWMFEDLAGMRPAAAGFEEITFRPEIPSSGLDWVEASTQSVRGEVAAAWRKDGDRLRITVTVPPNARGTVHLPTTDLSGVLESGAGTAVPVERAEGVGEVAERDGRLVVEVGSGTYEFEVLDADVELEAPTALERPAITGTPRVGEVLRASEGRWSVPGVRLSYEWLRDGTVIVGRGGPAYRVAGADVGHRISVRVRAEAARRPAGVSQSAATARVQRLRSSLTVSLRPAQPRAGGELLVRVRADVAGTQQRSQVVVRAFGLRRTVTVRPGEIAEVRLPIGSAGRRTVAIDYLGSATVDRAALRRSIVVAR